MNNDSFSAEIARLRIVLKSYNVAYVHALKERNWFECRLLATKIKQLNIDLQELLKTEITEQINFKVHSGFLNKFPVTNTASSGKI